MALSIVPGQVIFTRLIPYPDGTSVQYISRPYLVVGVTDTHVETLIISSVYGKTHKLACQRPSGHLEGLDVSVLPIGSVSGLPVAPHPYG